MTSSCQETRYERHNRETRSRRARLKERLEQGRRKGEHVPDLMTRFIMLLIVLLIPVSLNGCQSAGAKRVNDFNHKLDAAANARNLPEIKRLFKNRPKGWQVTRVLDRLFNLEYPVDTEIIRTYIEAGGHPDGVGRTPYGSELLVYAETRDDIEMIKLLLTAGANVNRGSAFRKDTTLETILGLKQDDGNRINIEAIKLLIKAGAKVTSKTKKLAYRTAREDIIRLIEANLER